MNFLNKLNLKNTLQHIKISNQCTGQSIIHQTSFFYMGFSPYFSEYFVLLLELKKDFKYFIHACTVLKQEDKVGGSLPHTDMYTDVQN